MQTKTIYDIKNKHMGVRFKKLFNIIDVLIGLLLSAMAKSATSLKKTATKSIKFLK